MGNLTDRQAERRTVIVVGVDFSEPSLTALRSAESMAGSTGSELHLVHALAALPPPAAASEMATAVVTEAIFAETPETAELKLEQLIRRVAPTSDLGRVIGHLRVGDPAKVIVQLASDLGADLVVVGTHGRTGVSRVVFGSVAEKVVRFAPCPVLTVRPKTAIPIWEKIEPPCPDCVAVQRATDRAQLWCDVHAERHPRAHTYYEYPARFGVGAQTFRVG